VEVTGTAFERRTVPASGRVYAPRDWRGTRIRVIVSPDGYSVQTSGDGSVRVRVPATVVDRESQPQDEGENPPQIRVGEEHEGETVLLVRHEADRSD